MLGKVLRTLGGLWLEGREGFRKRKPLLLLAYLALEGPRSRHHLAELFWPNASDRLNSLSVALNQLRRLGLRLEGEEVLRVQVACDALDLLRALKEGELGKARELYGGRFLEGADHGLPPELEEWVWSRRESLAQALWTAHLRRGEALCGLGWPEEARTLLEEARSLPGVAEVVEGAPQLEPFPLEVQRAFFALGWVGWAKGVELLRPPPEALDFLLARGLVGPDGRPTCEIPPTALGLRVALELARRLPLGEAAPLYRAAHPYWEAQDQVRGREALLRLARSRMEEVPGEALAILEGLAPDPELLFLRARVLEQLGRYREALDLLEELPKTPETSALRASVLLRLGQVAEAQAEVEAAARGGPYAQAEALNLQGLLLLGQGRFQEAAEAFARAAVRFLIAGEEGRHLSALSNRAVALAELGQGEEAFQEVLQAAQGRDWLKARIYLNLGVLKERRGQVEEAERLYRTSLALAQGNLEAMGRAWNNLGVLYHRAGRVPEAKAAYEEALQLAQKAQEWVLTATVLANLAELSGELSILEEAIKVLEEAGYAVLAERYRRRLEQFPSGGRV